MSRPTVAAVMLVNGREAMVRKAVECVRAQTYGSLSVIMIDTGNVDNFYADSLSGIRGYLHRPDLAGLTIGELRNHVNSHVTADIIVHFDSDDWSHPRRIEEQVALLQASGADAVGYNEALFWREPYEQALLYRNEDPRYCLGASLCYWRRTWERKPFEATSQGEDFRFCLGLKTVGVSSLHNLKPTGLVLDLCPRFIARIHAGNTSNAYSQENLTRASEWRRVPEQDAYCRQRMAL